MKERIGFIGLGNMGKPMAENLVRAGFEVTVHDINPAPVADLVARCRPLLEVVGEHIFHMGGLGMGQAAKICNNLLTLVNVQAVEEAMRLGKAVGIAEDRLRALVEVSSGDSWVLRNIDQMRAIAALTAKGPVNMTIFGRKDISLAVKLAQASGCEVPVTSFVFERSKH